jgi:hypothetical protein
MGVLRNNGARQDRAGNDSEECGTRHFAKIHFENTGYNVDVNADFLLQRKLFGELLDLRSQLI